MELRKSKFCWFEVVIVTIPHHSFPSHCKGLQRGGKLCLLSGCLETLWGMFETWIVRKPEKNISKKEMAFVKESSGNLHIGSGEPYWERGKDDYG